MNNHTTYSTDGLTPQDWTARWAISLTVPLYSIRMRKLIRTEMNRFATEMPHLHATLMSGILHDVITTFDPADPLRNLHRDKDGVIRLPNGEEFGFWWNYTDLMPASHADIGRDTSLAPAKEPLPNDAIEIFFRASHSWEDARDYVLEMSNRNTTLNRSGDFFESIEDAVRWAMLRREAYALDDLFVPMTTAVWSKRTPKILNGDTYDEKRRSQLRSAASVPPGTYEMLTGTEAPCSCDEPECAGGRCEANT